MCSLFTTQNNLPHENNDLPISISNIPKIKYLPFPNKHSSDFFLVLSDAYTVVQTMVSQVKMEERVLTLHNCFLMFFVCLFLPMVVS